MWRSSSSHATAPTAASSSPHSARCARGSRPRWRRAPSCPWPMAAGVFGIARTMAASARETRAESARSSCRPRSTETRRPRAAAAAQRGSTVRELIRLDREHDDVGAARHFARPPRVPRHRARLRRHAPPARDRRPECCSRHGPYRASRARAPAPCCRTRSTGSDRWRSTPRSLRSLEPHDSRCLARFAGAVASSRLAFAATVCHDARRSGGVRSSG